MSKKIVLGTVAGVIATSAAAAAVFVKKNPVEARHLAGKAKRAIQPNSNRRRRARRQFHPRG